MQSLRNEGNVKKISLRNAALIAGFGLLLMALVPIESPFQPFADLIVESDPASTFNNFAASEGLLRGRIVGFCVVILLDIIVAWALYLFLKPLNKNLSLLAALFRIIYSILFAYALFNLTDILFMISGTESLGSIELSQMHFQTTVFFEAFRNGWLIGLMFFAIHLGILGYMFISLSGTIPKILGLLLIIAGLGYLTDSLGNILSSSYHLSVSMFTFGGELLMMVWLIVMGIWKKSRLENLISPSD